MNKTALLSQIPLFANQRPEGLERLAGLTSIVSVKAGQVIVEENRLDKRFFVVLKGAVEVVKALGAKGEKRLQTLGPGAHFGEMALIDGRERSASVVAAADTEILCIDAVDIDREIRENPDLAVGLLKAMSLRLRAMNTFVFKALGRIPPVCLCCEKICENDRWVDIETYIETHSGIEIQHTLCPKCSIAKFPHFYARHEAPPADRH